MSATNPWPSHAKSPSGPYQNLAAITPDNSNDLATISSEIMVAGGGTVKVDTLGGQTVTFTAVAGYRYPIRAKRIYATGTSATGIVVLY
jgi:hypothetical protein